VSGSGRVDDKPKSEEGSALVRPDLAVALDAIYAYATDPENWEEMSTLLAHLDAEEGNEELQTVIEGVRQHLTRAEALAQRLHDMPSNDPDTTYCHMVVTRDFRVADLSAAAGAMLHSYCGPLEAGQRLRFLEPENTSRFRALMSGAGGEKAAGEGLSLLRLVSPEGDEAVFGYVVAEERMPEAMRRRFGVSKPLPKDAVVFVAPDREAANDEPKMYRDTFGLTPAEARLAACLKDGLSLKEAAEKLGLSVNTVRNQVKSVFEKLGVNRQSDLIRHLTELSRLASYIQVASPPPAFTAALPGVSSNVPRCFVDMPNGRQTAFREYGDRDGQPVLMLRSSLASSLIRPQELAAVKRYGIRLVVVERPGCGQSTPDPDMTYASFACDMERLLNALDLKRIALTANSSSVPLALSTALHLGDRVKRVALTTARFEPPMPRKGRPGMVNYFFSNLRRHPWLLDSTLAILRAKMSRPFMRSLVFHFFEKSPADFAVLERDAALVDYLIDETMDAIGWSVEGLVHESQLMLRETPLDFSGITVPVTLWHGEADGIIRLAEMREQLLRTKLKVSDIRTFPGLGHLFLTQVRDEFFAALLD
jgi:pimeloyl-ACP methyl ester carboxylesterase/DNA-binding CsgD family transcriptional regulator